MVRFIEVFGSLSRFLPEATKPTRRVDLREKIIWTAIALTLYLVMAEITLFGIPEPSSTSDPLFFLRLIFASRRGTLMELGIGPIVTAGLIMQLLVGSKIINVDLSEPSDRGLFTSSQKTFAIIIAMVEASAFIIGGAYGSLGAEVGFLIFFQLVFAGIMAILIDEMVQKGWGLGSGVSLFIAAGVCQQIFWQMFNPLPTGAASSGGDDKSFGAIIALFQTVFSGEAIQNAFFRPGSAPTMLGFIVMIVVFIVVIYFEGMRLEIPVAYAKYRGMQAKIPLKFLYVSNIPVILASALFANVVFFSTLVWQRFNTGNTNFWLNLFGMYTTTQSGQQTPIGGLVYYVNPPRNLAAVATDPVHATVYLMILCVLCVFFAKTWVEAAGLSARDQAKQLMDAGMQIPGFRKSPQVLEKVLHRYISILTTVSGLVIGLLAGFSDMLGAIGTGVGILLTVGIVYQYYQILMQEQMMEEYPMARRIFGET